VAVGGDELRRQYALERAEKTARIGLLASSVAVLVLAYMVYQDVVLLELQGTLGWRLLGILASTAYLAVLLVFRPSSPKVVLPLHALFLGAIVGQAAGFNFVVFIHPQPVPGASVGAVGALMVALFAAFVFAAGTRRLLPAIVVPPLVVLLASYLWQGSLTDDQWALYINPVIAAIVICIFAFPQEETHYNEFAMRTWAFQRKKELEARLAELRQLNARLAREIERRHKLELKLQEHTEELAQANLSLEKEVTERKETAAMLEHYAQTLRRSNEMLREFSYVASHDLKEPLRTLSGFLGLIRKRLDAGEGTDEKLATYMDHAEGASRRMTALIDGLLSYSRLDTHTDAFGPVNLGEVVDTVLQNLAAALEESDATVDVASLPSVHADAGQMVQLFQNLLSNVLKYRRPGVPPVARVRWRQLDASLAEVQVEDNGMGIQPEHRERVFQIFQRLQSASHSEGTGIGLAICKRIVERHGGTIRVSSSPGGGATFSFTLPTMSASVGTIE
jgi:signal transduction histidine kinase